MVRSAREAHGLSQESLAAAAGVSTSLIRQIESGRRGDGKPVRPTVRSLNGLALALHLDREALFATVDRPYSADALPSSQQQIAHSIQQLPPHLRSAVAAVVTALGEDQPTPSPKGAAA
jgi:transcriptional regulator with XRE-family HTH domain